MKTPRGTCFWLLGAVLAACGSQGSPGPNAGSAQAVSGASGANASSGSGSFSGSSTSNASGSAAGASGEAVSGGGTTGASGAGTTGASGAAAAGGSGTPATGGSTAGGSGSAGGASVSGSAAGVSGGAVSGEAGSDSTGSHEGGTAEPLVEAGASAGASSGSGGSSSGVIASPGGGPVTWVFSTFGTRANVANDSKLLIYTSTDGLNFTLLSATGGYDGPTGTLRDPSIMKYTDGLYYVAFTTPPTAGCCGPESSFSIASSADLAHWTTLTTVSSGQTGTVNTWAPEWFKDHDGSIHILVNIDTAAPFQTYDFAAMDSTLKSWSAPVAIGISPDFIDTFVVLVGATYHAFTKNEGANMVEHATATNLHGPWTFDGQNHWRAHLEAPAVIQLPSGVWRLFMDAGSTGGESYSDSMDNFATWTPVASLPTISALVSHGTVIKQM